MKLWKIAFFVITATSIFVACSKKNEEPNYELANDYYPMKVGNYIIYRMDSTNYVGYNLNPIKTTYYVQDKVESQITDNLGRPSYRIYRFIKKLLTDPVWMPSSTYYVTPLANTIESVENNLRVVRLLNPIKDNNSWKGNTYIESSGQYSQLQYLYDWEFQYQGFNTPKTYGTLSFNNTVTVKQVDETSGILNNPNAPSDSSYSVETFAKGTGLVYKEFLYWVYQPPNGSTPGYKEGYGLKLTIVAKN